MERITAEITAITTTDKKIIEKTTLEDLELFGGHSANICYTQKDWEEIVKEDYSKTEKRINSNKQSNHHSVFGHSDVTIYFTNIPKLLSMVLNNEHEYNTSEKSARYTEMHPTAEELFYYKKWIEIFELQIKKIYPNEKFLSDEKIHKLAMENARYLISVMTPTKMEYTTSGRQWNYLYDFASKMLEDTSNNLLIEMLKPSIENFMDAIDKTGIIDKEFKDYRNRKFSLIVDDNDFEEQWGRSYSTNYLASFAQMAQQQRHRTLDYNISLPQKRIYYIPNIIKGTELEQEWLKDIMALEQYVPQGTLVMANETGKYEDLILKLQERLCSAAQFETCMQNKALIHKYITNLERSKLKSDKRILKELLPFKNGARCLSGYKCVQPCGFEEGILLTRKI